MNDQEAPAFPLCLRWQGRRVLVVGGGHVAPRRTAALLEAGSDVLLVAPQVAAALDDLAERGRITWHQRRYAEGDLDGAWLAFACTDDPAVNAAVVEAATAQRIWCSRADDASQASAWTPPTARTGPVTVAVLSGREPRRSVALRDAALAAVEAELHGRRAETRRRPETGRVVLVGGGPGDPGLLT